MEPQLMKVLELSWEAWVDSGIDVRQLRDSNRVGVYTGVCGSEVSPHVLSASTVSNAQMLKQHRGRNRRPAAYHGRGALV